MENNRDVLEMLEFIAANNTPEQMEQAENELPVKDEIQEQSFALLREFIQQA